MMKKQYITIIFLFLCVYSWAQYEMEWRNPIQTTSNTSWITFSHLNAESFCYNLRWYGLINDSTSYVHNSLRQVSTNGDEVWTYDWNLKFPDHEFRILASEEENKYYFVAGIIKPNREYEYTVGLIELGNGVLWEINKKGLVTTGHLAQYGEAVNDGALILLSELDSESEMTSYTIDGLESWSVDVGSRIRHGLALLNDNKDNIWLLNSGIRSIYDRNGILLSQDTSLAFFSPAYNSGYSINMENELYQVHWLSADYLLLGFDESLQTIQSDTLKKACPAFGDWQMFIEDDNNNHRYLGGIELCETNSNYNTSLFRYTGNTQDWVFEEEGYVTGMKLAGEKLFYLNGNKLGVLDGVSGNSFWSVTEDTLSFSSDYESSLLVKENAEDVYVFSRESAGSGRSYITKYGLVSNNESELKVKEFIIYPNPSSGKFGIKGNQINYPLDYALYDLLGRQIAEGVTDNGQLDFSEHTSGLYMLSLNGEIIKPLLLN